MSEIFEILGEGWEGCVVKISNDAVMKVGFKETIINEFENLKKIPPEWQYFNPELITIEEVNRVNFDISRTEKMKMMFEKFETGDCEWLVANVKGFISIETFDITLYGITLPLIKGKSLNKIPLEGFVLKTALEKLHVEIANLNDRYKIFHNDLNLGNIMYDESIGKLTVIDWGYATFGEPLDKLFDVKYDIDIVRIYKYILSISK